MFAYNNSGNLLYKKFYSYSAAAGKTTSELLNSSTGVAVNYGYSNSGNKDQLTSYKVSGKLEYDNYGNPKKWFKHGISSSPLNYILQWGHVSNLIAITDDEEGKLYTYKYNDQGIRTEKVVDGVVHKYYLQGEQIIAEKIGEDLIKFYYDTTGVCGFNYNGIDYYYLKNIQGDILRIYSSGGTLYAEYSYDAWGKCTIKSGYYYDNETGLYYLNARYYDPEVGRFISADSIDYLAPEIINGINLYAYCNNNPVMYTDPSGCFIVIPFLIAGLTLLFTPVGGALVQTIASVVSYAGMAVASLWDETVRNDMNAIGWNPFNANEQAVLRSGKVSFYKGVPVFRTKLNRSGTFGAIFLRQNASINELRHEWGHIPQQLLLGPGTFGLMIGLPSALEWSERPYYSRPWEITADVFGGVTGRRHSLSDINRGMAYLFASSLSGIMAYLFIIGEYL